MSNPRPAPLRFLAALGLFLGLLAFVSGPRIGDDSFQHFGRSVLEFSAFSLRAWVTDTWNKPMNGLLYGIPGQLGLGAARLVSVGMTVASAFFTLRIGERLIPERLQGPRWAIPLLFISQMAVLKDTFVTMTELPAGFFIALALWLCLVKGRPRWAALAAGCAPLCRNEMLIVALFVGVWLAFSALRTGRGSLPQRLWAAFSVGALALLPFLCWVIAGVLLTNDTLWLARTSYAELRSFALPGLLRYNALSGLPKGTPVPALVFLILGMLSVPKLFTLAAERFRLALPAGVLGVHYLLLSTTAITPTAWFRGPPGRSISTLARNYNSTAVVAAVFMALGVAVWVEAAATRPDWFRKRLISAAVLVLIAVVSGRFGEVGPMALDLVLLAVTVAVVLQTTRNKSGVSPTKAWCWAAWGSLVACLLVRPFFWYPTRWNEYTAISVDALATLIQREQPPRVVQDLASSVVAFGPQAPNDAGWCWSEHFAERLLSAPPGTLVVVETDARHQPLGRYPDGITKLLAEAGRVQEVAHFDTAPQPAWLRALDRIASRNEPVYWVAYRVQTRP
jgi:hypothetical protein